MDDSPHLPPNSSLAKPISPALTPALRALLEGGQTDEAVATIIERPHLRQEAIAALPGLEREAKREARHDGVRSVVGRRLVLFPQTEMAEAEWVEWWSDYFEVCADLPMSALEAGMMAWVRDPESKFMPKPGELRQRSLMAPNNAAMACYRARKVAEYRDPVGREVVQLETPNLRSMPTPQSKEAVRRMFEDFSILVPREGPARAIPPVSGPVDGGGLTEAMRALLHRQYASGDA